jgi:hypothetical protein
VIVSETTNESDDAFSFDSSLLNVVFVCHDPYHGHDLSVPFHVTCYVDALMQMEKVIYCAPLLFYGLI